MSKLAMALAAAALLGLAAPALALENASSTQERIQAAPSDLSSIHRGRHLGRHMGRPHHRHHDRGLHRGFSHSRHLGYGKH